MHNTMSRQKTAICIAATALILSSLTTTTITANAQAPAFRNTHFSSGNELRPLTNRLPPVNEPPTIDPTFNSGLSNLGQAPVATSRQSEPTNISYEAVKMYEIALRTARGAQQFGLAAFHEVMAQTAEVPRDFMISPFAVWSLLLMLLQGSAGRTHAELAKTLNIDVTEEQLRSVFSQYQQALNIATPVVEVASLQALFAERRFQINEEYKNAIRDYGGVLVPVDFQNRYTYQTINEQVAQATRNFIKQTVNPQDLVDANMYMFSSLYFKGKWKYPFNASLTRTETFYNEQNEPIGNVEMMVQENKFVFTGTVAGLNAYVLELPYGEQDRLAMFIILPKRNVTLMEVANQLKTIGVSPILDKLLAAQQIAEGDVEVVMPKFNTSTDFKIKGVLEELGILEVFNSAKSDLSRIGPKGLFVSDCVHTTKIIVDEQGTTAAAVASATLVNKTSPPKFNLNKPFLYLILDKVTQLLLFAGKIVNPAFRG